ncbi:MAG: hypothetical protein V4640_14985 [Verrucomicrobiota bacterium]
MNENPPALPPATDGGKSCLIKGLVGLLILALVLGGVWWWYNRPIQPVTLSVAEKQAVEAKVEAMQKPPEPTYEKGSKNIVLTERELNGLLNENTTLGKTVKFELGTGVILARVETDLDPDLPVVGGRRLKARARILAGGNAGKPSLIIDDLTVWGISLPNDWLAGLKGRDLLGEIIGGPNGKVAGIEEFRIEPGQVTIRLAE